MLTHPTHERLIALGLTGMAKALEEQRRSSDLDALSFEERVGLLVDREAAERDTKRLTTRLKFAALRQSACVEDVDLRTPRGIDRAVFARLVGGDWIDRNENLLITGASGLVTWCTSRYVIDNRSFVAADLVILRDHSSPHDRLPADSGQSPGSHTVRPRNSVLPARHHP
ncbi:ATP-binding protein [Bradyrhizobium sp. SRL28]|uniref:ATP-binding protein n=1 Tax=Bradyrhizobium sp. SRL28 TaxID=2836178 RepID=UPI0024BF7552|nr:ATP-binding protein [Bradyrhizobium sp. SRL28]